MDISVVVVRSFSISLLFHCFLVERFPPTYGQLIQNVRFHVGTEHVSLVNNDNFNRRLATMVDSGAGFSRFIVSYFAWQPRKTIRSNRITMSESESRADRLCTFALTQFDESVHGRDVIIFFFRVLLVYSVRFCFRFCFTSLRCRRCR